MKLVVAELTHLARRAPEISQRSGVSVRVSICNYENLLSSALKRAIRLKEASAAPRVTTSRPSPPPPPADRDGDGGRRRGGQDPSASSPRRPVLNVFNAPSRATSSTKWSWPSRAVSPSSLGRTCPRPTTCARSAAAAHPRALKAGRAGRGLHGRRPRVRAGGPSPLAQAQQDVKAGQTRYRS